MNDVISPNDNDRCSCRTLLNEYWRKAEGIRYEAIMGNQVYSYKPVLLEASNEAGEGCCAHKRKGIGDQAFIPDGSGLHMRFYTIIPLAYSFHPELIHRHLSS